MRLLTVAVAVVLAFAAPAWAQRTYLTAPHYITVGPGTSATAAIQVAQRTLDTAGQPVIVTLLAGVHDGIRIDGRLHGGGTLYVTGQPGTIVRGINEPAFLVTDSVVWLSNVELRNQGVILGPSLAAMLGATIYVSGGLTIGPTTGDQVHASYGSRVHLMAPYTVTGNGLTHLHAYGLSEIVSAGHATFVGTPTFGAYVFGASASSIVFVGGHTGAVNGLTGLIHSSSLLFSGGLPLPGSLPADVRDHSTVK